MRSWISLDLATLVPAATVAAGLVALLSLVLLSNRGEERMASDLAGITQCPVEARHDLLSSAALQCWFDTSRGRWRTLSHVSAHGALVVDVEATDIGDAPDIAKQFVADRGGRFDEVLVYVQPDAAPVSIIRIRWTRRTGFETLAFEAHAAR